MQSPPRITIANGLDISRMVCGLWQVADMEKGGTALEPHRAADHLAAYAQHGFDTFDMADHYGSAEIITGYLLKRYHGQARRPVAFTKWCPEPGPMTRDVVRRGVQDRLDRLGVSRVDLLQFHWWSFAHPAWLDALHEMKAMQQEGLIGALGVTNFDAHTCRWPWPTAFPSPPTRCPSPWSTVARQASSRKCANLRASACSPMARCAAASSPGMAGKAGAT